MALVAPGLNISVRSLSKAQYGCLWFALVIYEIVACRGTAHIFPIHFGYSPVHFMIIYVLAAYFRLHGNPLPGWATWVGFLGIFRVQYYVIYHKIDVFFPEHWKPFACTLIGEYANYTNLFSILLTLVWMLSFQTLKMEGSAGNAICFLSAYVFAIYLTHQHPAWRSMMYSLGFRAAEQKDTPEQCCRSHFLFVFSTCLISILFDVYRGRMFAWWQAVEAWMEVKPMDWIHRVARPDRARFFRI
jgi:hypothetical protein